MERIKKMKMRGTNTSCLETEIFLRIKMSIISSARSQVSATLTQHYLNRDYSKMQRVKAKCRLKIYLMNSILEKLYHAMMI